MSLLPETLTAAQLDAPTMRDAGADLLSVALMDGRNQSLLVAARIHAALGDCANGEAAQTTRNRLCQRLAAHGQRLASFADTSWRFNADERDTDKRWRALQAELLVGMESLQDELSAAEPSAAALAPFRAAVELEDRLGQALIKMANTWANGWAEAVGSRAENAGQVWGTDWPAPHAHAARQGLWMPARRWALGASARARARLSPEAFAWANELHHASIDVPEFDIDAQPITWAQFVEFVDDGGYDREELWQAQGWAWAQQVARRAPLYVEQLGVASGAVLQRSFGRLTRRAGTHACMHVTYWEADAYARWAGRRLPTEHEWEIAACAGASQGFRWGDVLEWTLDRYTESPARQGEFTPFAADSAAMRDVAQHRSVRGASFAARQRQKIIVTRYHGAPDCDHAFVGFRTCSI
jgi:gamma-glutamyl hercynylcysteine S-oxide synthase